MHGMVIPECPALSAHQALAALDECWIGELHLSKKLTSALQKGLQLPLIWWAGL